MRYKAYAKINLSLKVVKKRDDGYHDLDMLMINVNLYDTLVFRKSNEVLVTMNKDLCNMEDNLVYKTIIKIKRKYNIDKGIDVYIKKRIPSMSGLGGGSADAALTICVLNHMWDLNLDLEELNSLALEIGSDVPFFLYNCFSRVMGRGEKVLRLSKKFNRKIILAFPNLPISTKKVFEAHDIKKSDKDIVEVYNSVFNEKKLFFNDLEGTVSSLYPEYVLKEIKRNLESKFECCVTMSGSGSSFFIVSEKQINKIYRYIRKNYPDLKIVKNKTISYCKRKVN